MFKKSDLENTDWWSLCHDPSKSVKPRKIRANASSQLSFQMLARQQKNRINKLEMIKNAQLSPRRQSSCMSQVTDDFNTNAIGLETQASVFSPNASFNNKSAPKRRATLIEISTDTSHAYKMELLKKF